MYGELPDWFYTTKTGDWALHVLNAEYGKIGYINEVMAAYRIHKGGFWSSEKWTIQLFDGIELLNNLNAYNEF